MLQEEKKFFLSLSTQFIISLAASSPHQKPKNELDFLPHPQTLPGPLILPPLLLLLLSRFSRVQLCVTP